MKRFLFVPFLFLFCAFAFADGVTEKPFPAGRGTYAELGDNATFEKVTAENILYKENVGGAEVSQNFMLHTNDLNNAVWGGQYLTLTDNGTSWLLNKTSSSDVKGRLAQTITGMDLGSDITMFIKARSLSTDYQPVELTLLSYDPYVTTSQQFYLDSTQYQILRLSGNIGVHANGWNWGVNGETTTALYSLRVSEIAVYYTLPTVLINFGDSIANQATRATLGIPYFQSTYAMLYANTHRIEIDNQAAGGNTITDVLADVQTYLSVNKYPIAMLQGGVNDIGIAGETIGDPEALASSMFATMVQAVDIAKTSSSIITLLNCPDIPIFSASQTITAGLYNAKLGVKYGSDSSVYLIDTDLGFSAGEYCSDDIHITPSGHILINAQIEAAIDSPKYVNTYGYVNTYDTPIVSAADVLQRVINTSKLRTITGNETILTTSGNFLLDADDNTVTVKTPASPYKDEVHTFKSINADNTCTVSGNGENIDGSATTTLAVNESITIQYDGTEWQIISYYTP